MTKAEREELAALRAEVAALRAEVAALRAAQPLPFVPYQPPPWVPYRGPEDWPWTVTWGDSTGRDAAGCIAPRLG